MIITAIVFLLILSVLVLIHEAGHYFVAKKFGIKVEEFGFGFPLTPPIWQKKKGETLYSFYPILIGGFVKLYGEDEAGAGRIAAPKDTKKGKDPDQDPDQDRAFFSRSIWQRTAVIVAGVLMNVILAVVIFYTFLALLNFKTAIPVIGENPPSYIGVNQQIVPKGIAIGRVSPNSPADQAGIKSATILTKINGQEIKSNDALGKIISDNKGKEITVEWYDIAANKFQTASMTPRVSPPKDEGSLGIAFDYSQYDTVLLNYETPTQKLFSGFSHSYNLQLFNLDGLGTLFNQSVQEKRIEPISDNVSGPVGIGALVNRIVEIPDAKEQVLQLLNLAGILSLSLAFFNILPIPGLDGGRLFFILLEAVIGRKVNPKIEGYFHAVGMVLLIALLLLVTIKDVTQLFK
ncbi:MAG: site-2 protease family protein [Candidatus Levybacteria bacterium]|nr:site-2 protease family protein [Candidatus Levybacteria bacterium]